ncbi:anti-sigma factor domain-containing protein [Blautia sp. Marseille-P3201T]|uniref:anti-sigma factor domain-containing protein n=1 Tax=Blautia sp. Marseille-P3201T TaxID=1907659 RepID=UPI0009319A8B|nr:anti-sigma factor domain-containing protein [Blautia sp. Marseille-P3201T]
MYHKVIILEIKDGYALAMTEDGEIIRIKKKAGMKVGAAVYVLEEDRYKKVRTLQWQKAAAIAAAILLCITSLLLPQFSQQVYAMVELEGVKSVSVKIDKNYKIQDAYSYDDTVSLKALKDLEGQKLQDLKEIAEELRDADGSLTVVYAMYKEDEKVSKELEEALQKIFGNENVTYMKGKIEEIQEPDKKQKTDIITGKKIIAEPKPAEEDDEENTETDIEDAEEPENEEDESFSEEDEPDSEETDIEPETEEPEEPEVTEQENKKPETSAQENQEPEDTEEEEQEETEDEED